MPNPVLSQSRWTKEAEAGEVGWAAPGTATGGASGTAISDGPVSSWDAPAAPRLMTLGGTFWATAVLFLFILISGAFGWAQVSQTTVVVGEAIPGQEAETQVVTNFPGWVFIPMLVGFGFAILTAFKPTWARITAPLYAIGFGFALGAISHMYDLQSQGIVLQAIGATAGVFLVMLFLYGTRIIKVTPKYVAMVMGAMGGILVLYLSSMVLSLFGADITFWREPTLLGIGISVVIVIVAALNLAIDFNFIENAVANGAPKSMEWMGAFGLTVSLVWLYLEILRLLSLLRQ